MGVLSTARTAAGRTTVVWERVFDRLFAGSVASWAVLGLTASTAPPTAVRWATAALHLVVAHALFRRAPLERAASTREVVASFPALVLAGVAFRLAAPLGEWPLLLESAFVLGAALAIGSFIALGDSFAILPGYRGVVTLGPYRFVRHPAYVGELVMIGACALSRPSPGTLAVLASAIPLVALRIAAEERALSRSPAYERYRAAVTSRLLPGVW